MKNKINETDRDKTLRQQAEEELRHTPPSAAEFTPLDFTKLTHELSVHQIELEMQNDELLRFQAEIEGTRRRYSDLFDFAPVGYFVLDEHGVIRDANITGATLLGLVKKAAIGKRFSNYVNRNDQDDYFLFHRKMLETPARHDLEIRLIKKEAGPFYSLIQGMAVKEPVNGKIQYRIAVTDITGQKTAEEALRNQKDRLEDVVRERTSPVENKNARLAETIAEHRQAEDASRIKDWAIESAISAIVTTDMEGTLNYVNPAFLRMWAYGSPAEVLGKPAVEFWQEGGNAREAPEAVRNNGGWLGEQVARRKDGSLFDVYVSSSTVLDGAGRTVCMMASFEDITLRKKLENARNFLLQYGQRGSGKNFFESLARYLSQSLGMEYVCIGRLEGDGLTARTVAVYNDGLFESNVAYALKDTPYGDVVGKPICCFRENVCALFPHDAALRDLKAESYVGATLWSYNKRPIGLIALIGRMPLTSPEVAEGILKLAAIRAAGEMEHTLAEDDLQKQTEELKIINEDLSRFNRAMVGRELRMIELKKQMNGLYVELGQPPCFSVGLDDNDSKAV